MIKHYLLVALRNLRKDFKFTAINTIGLTTGLTGCILMALYIQHDLSYDEFHTNGDRLVRVIMEYSLGGSVIKGNFTSTKVAPAFKRNFHEIEETVTMANTSRVIRYKDKLFNEKSFAYADSGFFRMFSFELIKGNPKLALSGPNAVIFTESAAKKYFEDEEPVGKTIKVGSSETEYRVTGVMHDCPSNSQIKFDFLGSFVSLDVWQEETYWNANYISYFLLKNPSSIMALQEKIPGFMKKEMASELSGNDYVTFYLELLKDIHLYSEYDGFEPNSSIVYVYITGALAILVLAIACFTFINLSTARSLGRAKEVGVRKASGAQKRQIFWQFIGESALLSLMALTLSIAIAIEILPAFGSLAERQLDVSSIFSPLIIGCMLFILISISFFAGSYPALVLSRLDAVSVLKGVFRNTGSGLWLRESLIVFQFVISTFLVVSTFVIRGQLQYIQNKKLGFEKEHMLVLPLDQKMMDQLHTIKSEFKTNPDVISLSKVSNKPVNIVSGYSMRSAEMAEKSGITVNANVVDEDFIKTIGAQILTGTDFTTQDVTDVMNESQDKKIYHYIINESAAKALGWDPVDAVGKKMFLGEHRPGMVKAVVKDFHFSSLRNPIKPLVLFNERWGGILLVKLSGRNMQETLSFLESKWKSLVPYRPFEYRFLDEDYDLLYNSEIKLGKVVDIFAAAAVWMASLGLFGLCAFAIQQRTKEIGIRKVIGATVMNIAVLISEQFIKLVLIALLISLPIAWIVMAQWLNGFVYRTDIQWWMFAISGLATITIALFTVSLQAIKAATANPVDALKYE